MCALLQQLHATTQTDSRCHARQRDNRGSLKGLHTEIPSKQVFLIRYKGIVHSNPSHYCSYFPARYDRIDALTYILSYIRHFRSFLRSPHIMPVDIYHSNSNTNSLTFQLVGQNHELLLPCCHSFSADYLLFHKERDTVYPVR